MSGQPAFQDAYEFLLALPRYDKRGASALKPGFERIRALLEAMGNPEKRFPSVLVAGTNGKGSTASMTAAIATAHGLRTGLHTSPHIFSVTERMRIDGTPAESSWLAAAVAAHREAIARIEPSFFEATVALSLKYFAEASVDLAVVEVGLGGRLDATNILEPVVCAISRIGFDHMDFLGDTLEKIASEKAGILKRGVPAWTSNEDPAVLAVLRQAAEAAGTAIVSVDERFPWYAVVPGLEDTVLDTGVGPGRYRGLRLGLRGRYQAENALLALAVSESALGQRFDAGKAADGLARIQRLSGLRGRLEVVRRRPLIVADAAHNPSGIQSALAWLADVAPGASKISVAFALMRDKAVDEIVALLLPRLRVLYLVSLDTDRAIAPSELAGRFGDAATILEVGNLGDAIDRFERGAAANRGDDVLLVVGSHQLLAQLPRQSHDGFDPET